MSTRPKAVPTVAVITRTKDRPLLLERAIKSVEAQTYANYVHVILNDGGDRCAVENLLERYKDERRVVVHNKEPVGITRALNQAIRAVNSVYIAILDDDDTWATERLEKTILYLETSGEKAAAVKMDVVVEEIVGDGIRTISQHLHPESGEGEISLFKQCHKNYLSNAVITYRRDVYNELAGYDETLPVGEDWDFGIRLLLKYDVAFLRDEPPLTFYHQRPNEIGAAGNSVYAKIRQQELTINVVRNRYLRRDLIAGKLGIGYVMNELEYNKVMVERLEAHMNHCTEQLKQRIDSRKTFANTLSYLVRKFR